VYTRAFFDYPMLAFYFPERKRRERYLEWYLGCAITYALRYGEVYTTPGIAGVACWLPPGQTEMTLLRSILSGFFPTPWRMGRENYRRSEQNEVFMARIHREILPGAHWYLWGLTVDPSQQGQGIGTQLMQPIFERGDAGHLPCYLETHDQKNVLFYGKRGFDLVRSETLPGYDLPFWCMVRQPKV
jgi:GNAT superfamily N-acetyltransferase